MLRPFGRELLIDTNEIKKVSSPGAKRESQSRKLKGYKQRQKF
jgi:hypothetical protein